MVQYVKRVIVARMCVIVARMCVIVARMCVIAAGVRALTDLLLFELRLNDEERAPRQVAVAQVLVEAVAAVVPLARRLSRGDASREAVTTRRRLHARAVHRQTLLFSAP